MREAGAGYRAPLMWPLASVGLLLLVAAPPSYEARRRDAEPVKNLGRFLEQYVGDCEGSDPRFDRTGCESAAAEVRKNYQGRLLRVEVDELGERIRLGPFDHAKGAFRLHLTPIFPERSFALSVGKPERLNAEGQPVLRNLPVWVRPLKGQPDFVFRRELERGMVRLELLVRPKRAWRMEPKRGDPVRGVDVELVGLRVHPARGDGVLGEETY